MKAPRLYLRIYLHGLLVLVLLALAVGISVHMEGRSLTSTPPADVARHLGRWLARSAPQTLPEDVRRAGHDLEVRFTLYTDDGGLLASSGRRPVPPLPPSELARLGEAADGWI